MSERRHDDVVDALRASLAAVVVGDPRDRETQLGPLISRQHRDNVLGYVSGSRDRGGKEVTGGAVPSHLTCGWYVEPTLVTGVSPASKIAQEEIFGPVLTVLTYRDLDEAVAIVNRTSFGLSGAVFT